MENPEKIQRAYYTETANKYDSMHWHDDEHYRALEHIERIANQYKIKTFLDIGCGTGRGVEFLLKKGFLASGVDSSKELLNQGIMRNPILKNHVQCANGYHLPYANNSFDAVCEFGVLHHVRFSHRVINEMLRVARKAVFISDSNRFGQGKKLARYIKFLLWKLKLWPLANYIKTNGKGYTLSEGDGLSYSYSVYDSYSLLNKWATEMVQISTDKQQNEKGAHSLILKASHVLLACIKITE